MRASSMPGAAATSRFFLLPALELVVVLQGRNKARYQQCEPSRRRST